MIQDIPDWTTAIYEAQKIILGTYTHNDNFDDQILPKEPKNFEDVCRVLGKAMELLLISKNQKYGKGNILNARDFGMTPQQGTALRMNDKFERIKNGLRGVNLGKEGFIESAGDLVGYNAIIIMLELGWYELPISDEGNNDSKD